ncbi:TPA: hypothetical protein EYN98_03755 [Candidatus Poribacteria bacterium]|nr:hypothetical protein [Candidatus Poribacteria bacterium]
MDPPVSKVTVLSRNGFRELFRFCQIKNVENVIFDNVSQLAQNEVEMEIVSRFLEEQKLNLHPVRPDISFEHCIGPGSTQQMIETFSELERNKVALRLQSGRISKSLVNVRHWRNLPHA